MSSKPMRSPVNFANSLIFLIAVVLAGGVGLMIGAGAEFMAGLAVFGIAGLCAALYPEILLWVTLALAFVIVGLVRLYLPFAQNIRWLLLPIALALAVHGLVRPRQSEIRFPVFVWFSFAFLAVLVCSSIFNTISTTTVLLGLKGYFQLYGVFIALALLPISIKFARRLPMFFLALALIQIPFVLHQFLVIVPSRVGLGGGVVPVDVVAGTFGAYRFGGGENSVFAAYMVIMSSAIIVFWRNGILSPLYLVATPLIIAPVFVTESKISLIYIVVAFLVVSFKNVVERPLRVLATLSIGAVLCAAMLVALVTVAPKEKVQNVSDLFAYTWSYNVANDEAFDGAHSRAGAYRHWFNHQRMDRFGTFLIGYGAGATRYEDPQVFRSSGYDVVPTMRVGRTGALGVLWEGGVLGLICVIGMFVTAYRLASRYARRFKDDNWLQSAFTTVQVALAVLFVSFFDKSYFVFQIGYQAILVFALGYLALWTDREAEDTGPEPKPKKDHPVTRETRQLIIPTSRPSSAGLDAPS